MWLSVTTDTRSELDLDLALMLRCGAHRLTSVLECGTHMLALKLKCKATYAYIYIENVNYTGSYFNVKT